ncbi:hypothetical protein NDI56_03810 [Haloarcula sp. S1CR25-12]|uniref:Halobacterial output domain-containing protein n=1 Tax=Haloarcula saliterrae TaxID=2950534 RepID=A0ABU2F8I6_9EURY|nr:hypothetical protein [Haloarcula sp. S1CR25-12]MDS0258536.1 hypothetical protein [Haloarcula sp. S1CR25-12]
MNPLHEADDARELAPDDVVGNALCDALLDNPDPAVIRVLNAHGEWARAAPSVQDYCRTLEQVPSIVARWPADSHGTDVFVYVRDGSLYRYNAPTDEVLTAPKRTTATGVRSVVDARGRPELLPREDTVVGGDVDE